MKFGYFDDRNKEYVITTPQTPLPWINYLGSEDFFSLVSNTAGGYSFYRDARMRRLTRYRYNNSPLDMDGHRIYIKDGDTVRAVTPLGDVSEGEAMVRGGQVKGAFSVSFGYGHSNYGAQDIDIDGQVAKGNPAIAAGVRTHQMLDPLVSVDGVLGILSDHDASSPGRCGSMFKIEKA